MLRKPIVYRLTSFFNAALIACEDFLELCHVICLSVVKVSVTGSEANVGYDLSVGYLTTPVGIETNCVIRLLFLSASYRR